MHPLIVKTLLSLFLLAGTACASVPASDSSLPPESEYVIVRDGQLTVGGERQRYWSAIGEMMVFPDIKADDSAKTRAAKVEEARQGTQRVLRHLEDVGFNSVRLWQVHRQSGAGYTPGDGSRSDMLDYFISEVKKRGWRIWTPAFNRAGHALPEDVTIIDEPATAEAWRAALASTKEGRIDVRDTLARIWDPRLEAVYLRNLHAIADHRNPYTGLRMADDPVFGVWELTNEEWWMTKMLGGGWQRLPEYFHRQLTARWNAWLADRYADHDALIAAWGTVLPGENLATRSLSLAPMRGRTAKAALNDANPLAAAALEGEKQAYTRADFPPARASDVIAFFLDLQLSHKERVAAAVRTWGKSTALSPIIYDTGIGYEIQSQFIHQNADATAHDAYVNGWGPAYIAPVAQIGQDPQAHRLAQLNAERGSANVGPWVNWLLKPPGIAQGVPWLEHNRVEGKPYLAYETQIQQPAKYRADFPLRLLALASIQDWDWICWHYFGPVKDAATNPRPFEKPLDITTGTHPQGYHYTFDEVQNSTMRAAAFLFRGFAYAPAPTPTRFIFGRRSLTDPASMDYAHSYGRSGLDMLQTTYQYGVRIQIDPTREDDEVVGPVVSFDDRATHNPYTPTGQIIFDWKKGYLGMDAPAGVAWTGLLGRFGPELKFANGVSLSRITFNNPPGSFDPVTPAEGYLAFALHSLDGRPLAETGRANLSLVSTSYNTGFSAPRDNMANEGGNGIARGKVKAGTTPVLVTRVGATVRSPHLTGMEYVFRDWEMQELARGRITGDTLIVPDTLPIFCVELVR